MLSLFVPSRHVVLFDSVEFIGCIHPVPLPTTPAFTLSRRVQHSQVPHHPLQVGDGFRSFTSSYRYDLSSGSPPLADPTGTSPADRGSYSWASIGLVTLPDARYDYGGNWAISTDVNRTRWNSSRLPAAAVCRLEPAALLIGVFLSAALFGAGHIYQGAKATVVIGAYGLMFGILAEARQNLRLEIITHAWHYAITGLVIRFLPK
jgi:hypothetical protein